jgi:hypothetical protein
MSPKTEPQQVVVVKSNSIQAGNEDFVIITYGAEISLQAPNGLFAIIESDAECFAASEAPHAFVIVNALRDRDQGPVAPGDKIYLRSEAGTFVSAETDGRVVANRNAPDSRSKWVIVSEQSSAIRSLRLQSCILLKSCFGTFLAVDRESNFRRYGI